jgi:hypothetical protein
MPVRNVIQRLLALMYHTIVNGFSLCLGLARRLMEHGWAFRKAGNIFGTDYVRLYIWTASVQITGVRDKGDKTSP